MKRTITQELLSELESIVDGVDWMSREDAPTLSWSQVDRAKELITKAKSKMKSREYVKQEYRKP